MNIERFDSNRVWLSETEDPDALYAKFLICDFSTNLNHVRINRERIEEWMETLKDEPLVGKIVVHADGARDFTGHNAKVVKRTDEDGTEVDAVEFDTSAFGTFVDVGIETVDEAECIVATAKVWKRFHDASSLIKKRCKTGELHTSWEISVDEYSNVVEDGEPVKVIDSGRFIGHCLLGKNVLPAYPTSGLLDVAEADEDQVLLDTIVREVSVSEAEEPSAPEQAAKTHYDLLRDLYDALRRELQSYAYIAFWFPEEHAAWCKTEDCAGELDYILVKYAVREDESIVIDGMTPVTLTISVSEINASISGLNETVAQLNKENTQLRTEIESLEVYRAEHDEAVAAREKHEHEEAVASLRQYVIDSGRFTDEEMNGEELSALIESADVDAINRMISERVVSEMRAHRTTEVSTAKPRVEVIVPPIDEIDGAQLIRNYLRT